MTLVGRPSRRSLAAVAGWLVLVRAYRSGAANPVATTDASGTLEGMVTLACRSGAADCHERPYRIGLFLEDPRTGRQVEPIQVSVAGRFALRVMPGTYRIVSADVRGACCLPILRPITVTIVSGRVAYVHVRLAPGLQLPTR
jgi:hypothetical protein